MAYNPSQYMSSNYEIRKYNGKYYSFQPTKTKDIGGGEAGFGGVATELVGVNDSNIYQMYGFRPNEVPNAVISPTDYNNNAKYTTDEIKQQIQTIFAEMDPRNETGWQSNLDTIVSNAASKLTTDPSLGSKAITNSWNDYRYSPEMTKPVWMINNTTGGLVQMPAAEAKAAMNKGSNISLYGGGQVAVFNVNGNSYYYDPNSAEAKKNMATIAKSAAVGTPNYDPSEPLKFGGLQTIAPQTWTAEDTASAGIASGISSIQNANNRPEFTSQEQAGVYGQTGKLIDTAQPEGPQLVGTVLDPANQQPVDHTNKMLSWEGDHALAYFASDPNQLYWLDNTNKTMQMISSKEGAAAFLNQQYGVNTFTADNLPLSTPLGGDFLATQGFTQIQGTAGLITADGKNPYVASNPPVQTSSGTLGTYNQPATSDKNSAGLSMVSGMLSFFGRTGIDGSVISAIANDPKELGILTSAITYGGYSPADIYREVLRYKGVAGGDTSLSGIVAIDPNQNAVDFKKTPAYTAMANNATLKVPSVVGDFDIATLELPVYQLPDEVFNGLKAGYDIQSPEFQAEMDKVKTLLYDAKDQLLNAQTQQSYQVAQANYQQLVANVKESYGIVLSNNAYDAYNQIDSIGKSAASAGLYGSGLMDEAIDKTLTTTRKNDQLKRNDQLKAEDVNKANYYQTSASSAEIAALTPEERQKYGLTPSQEAIDFYSIANLRKQYPDTPDSLLQQYADSVIDTSTGTPVYRSTLYSQMYANKFTNAENKRVDVQKQVEQQYIDADTVANKEYSFSDPYSGKTTQFEANADANKVSSGAAATKSLDAINTATGVGATPKTPAIDVGKITDSIQALKDSLAPQTPAKTPDTSSDPGISTKTYFGNLNANTGTTKMKDPWGQDIDVPNANVDMSLKSGYTKA